VKKGELKNASLHQGKRKDGVLSRLMAETPLGTSNNPEGQNGREERSVVTGLQRCILLLVGLIVTKKKQCSGGGEGRGPATLPPRNICRLTAEEDSRAAQRGWWAVSQGNLYSKRGGRKAGDLAPEENRATPESKPGKWAGRRTNRLAGSNRERSLPGKRVKVVQKTQKGTCRVEKDNPIIPLPKRGMGSYLSALGCLQREDRSPLPDGSGDSFEEAGQQTKSNPEPERRKKSPEKNCVKTETSKDRGTAFVKKASANWCKQRTPH